MSGPGSGLPDTPPHSALRFRSTGHNALSIGKVLEFIGIRTKLIILIKVLPLILLAVLAWEGVLHLGGSLTVRTDTLTKKVSTC